MLGTQRPRRLAANYLGGRGQRRGKARREQATVELHRLAGADHVGVHVHRPHAQAQAIAEEPARQEGVTDAW